jgi:2-polyprenyl-3-methyl-5-hydroxy-6-metoxy-1,4-benzoquinol methylase
MDLYEEKPINYYGNIRYDALEYFPKFSDRVLEIGCGTGETLKYLKSNNRCNWIGGVDIYKLRNEIDFLDYFQHGSVDNEDININEKSIDVILCLDVLEHLVDPWSVIKKISKLLKKDGIIIISLPNIQHYSISIPLLFAGKWSYQESGIMDKTHLRFFSRQTAQGLINSANLRLLSLQPAFLSLGGKVKIINSLTFGLFSNLLTYQYILVVKKL